MPLPNATPNLVERYLAQFRNDERYFLADEALIDLFEKFPANTKLQDILLKVSALNDLYSTNIFATYQMAHHIQTLDIDPDLAQKSTAVVNHIAAATFSGKRRNVYSFATKYCSWHDQDSYPIYDWFVEQVLLAYQEQDSFDKFTKLDLKDYATYKRVLEGFRERYQLTGYSFKQLDKFLWLLGKDHFTR